MDQYINRSEAGKILAKELRQFAKRKDVIALALPRGGVPVGFELAKALSIPLDVFIVRKLGVPGHVELAMGAIASGGIIFLNEDLINMLGISQSAIDEVIASESEELQRRESSYRNNQPLPPLKDKTVLLIDDGIATGATMIAAVNSLRLKNPARIIIAVPVASEDTCAELAQYVDELICPYTPDNFMAVGLWYKDFNQTTDIEVGELLKKAKEDLQNNTH